MEGCSVKEGTRLDSGNLRSRAHGLLLGAAKIGLVGTVGFAIAWWRSRRKLEALRETLPDPGEVEARLAALEQSADYTARQLDRLVDGQASLARQLGPAGAHPVAADPDHRDRLV